MGKWDISSKLFPLPFTYLVKSSKNLLLCKSVSLFSNLSNQEYKKEQQEGGRL